MPCLVAALIELKSLMVAYKVVSLGLHSHPLDHPYTGYIVVYTHIYVCSGQSKLFLSVVPRWWNMLQVPTKLGAFLSTLKKALALLLLQDSTTVNNNESSY